MTINARHSRRQFLLGGLSAAAAVPLLRGSGNSARAGVAGRDKLPVAAIITVYRPQSHADVIIGKILEGHQQDGGPGADLRLVSLYVDQVPETDMSRRLAEKHGFRLSPTIDDAITHGTGEVRVAGVLSIGEHGDYPSTPDTKQRIYPRRRFFDGIVEAFRRCGKAVPVFNDKHLSYKWDDAWHMVQTARATPFPLLAGSSLPVAWRYPALELPLGCEIESALAIGYSDNEAYGFHALETLACMIERRRGGETGVASVQAVRHAAIREAERAGEWSGDLFRAALATLPGAPSDSEAWTRADDSAAFLMRHRDGLKSAVIMANGLSADFAFAVKLKGESRPLATWFKLQEGVPYGHFAYLVRAFEHTVHEGRTAYPVERTLLTTGILDRVMQSLSLDGRRLETPELDIAYSGVDWPFANDPKSGLTLPNN